MTTYTITQSEYDQLIKLANKIICVGNGNLPGNSVGNDLGRDVIAMLRNLQLNTQEHIKEVVVHADYREMWRETLRLNQQLCAQLSAPKAKPLTDEQKRCPLCRYDHGHSIGCDNNPVDIALKAANGVKP